MNTRTAATQNDTVLSAHTLLTRHLAARSVLTPLVDWLAGAGELKRLWQSAAGEVPSDQVFHALLSALNISVQCSPSDLERIPTKGPTVIVANHPHGLLDGI